MSRNSRETRLPAGLLDDPRFVALSVSARLVYLTLRMLADDEGRMVASPSILEANGRLATLGAAGIVAALSEAAAARLVALYVVEGREYAFLPDAFANPGGIRYWARSACPLPPTETLAIFPDYTSALARLDAHARLGFNGEPWTDRRDAPRYARELWPALWKQYESQHHEQSRSARVERDSAG